MPSWIRLVERFLAAGMINITPPLFNQDPLRRRIVLTLIRFENTQALALVFDTEQPIRSTGDMRSWYTGKPCELTSRSHIKGVVRKYRPDFLIRLASGTMLVLEVKGQDSPEDRTKREFLAEWVRAVNEHGGFGRWAWDISFHPKDVRGILNRLARSGARF